MFVGMVNETGALTDVIAVMAGIYPDLAAVFG